MKSWEVKNNSIVMSKEESAFRIDALLKEYRQLVKKLGDYTPEETVNVLRSNYREWLSAVEPSFNLHLVEELDKLIIEMGADPYWGVSFNMQKKVVSAFNRFLKDVKRHNVDKKDSKAVGQLLNNSFAKTFDLAADNRSINAAIMSNKQFGRVAKRLVKRLDKMGYAFK